MADYDFTGREVAERTISATTTFQLDPGWRYAVDLSGNDGGASDVDVKYLAGDKTTYVVYPDNPGGIDDGLEITAPRTGVVQVAVTGGSGVAIVVGFAKIRS